MRNFRCSCGRVFEIDQKKTFGTFLTNKTCDVYGCPSYTNSDWTFFTRPKRAYRIRKSANLPADHQPEVSLSVIGYFFDSLGKSSINGISNCIASSGVVAKLVWMVVFVSCLSGFCYQAYQFYVIYSDKPSVVQIEVENDGEVDFPAVTICTTNRIRKSAYCKYFPTKCLNDTSNLTLTDDEINKLMYDTLLNKQKDIWKNLGHPMSILQGCTFYGTPDMDDQECLKVWEVFFDPDYGNCYTFMASNKEGFPLQAREVDFWQEDNDLNILVDIETREFLEVDKSPGLVVTVHDVGNYPDIHTEGILLDGGHSYAITFARTTVLLLPPPFKTNCTAYDSLPWQKTQRKKMNSRMCTVGCSQYHQLQSCNYITESISLFSDELPFEAADITDEKRECAKAEENNTLHYCRSICGLPCTDTYFTTTVSGSELLEHEIGHTFRRRDGKKSPITDIVHVKLYYSTLEHKIYRHTPKYETMELFSYLGGYSGVWLGFSLLTLYELTEIILSTIMYGFRKQQQKKQQQQQATSVFITKNGSALPAKSFRRSKYGKK